MATWRDLEDYRKVSEILEERVTRDLAVFFARVKDLPAVEMRDRLVEVIPALIDKYGSAAATAAAQWFENLTELKAVVPDLYRPAAWEANTRWALSPLFDGRGDLRAVFVNLVAVATSGVKNHGRSTIAAY